MKQIAVLIPAHNEEVMLRTVLERVPKRILDYNVRLVVADDASTDDTALIATDITPHVVSLPQNSGVGATTKAGLLYLCQFDDVRYVIKLDGDGQHLPEFIEKVVKRLEMKARIVCCSRFHRDSDTSEARVDRILLNKGFSHLMSDITGWDISDARTGFMGFHFEDIQAIAKDLIIQRYGIPMELLLRVWALRKQDRFSRLVEIAHPALYQNVSGPLNEKYSIESYKDRAERFRQAAESLLLVLGDLKIDANALFSADSVKSHARRGGDYKMVG